MEKLEVERDNFKDFYLDLVKSGNKKIENAITENNEELTENEQWAIKNDIFKEELNQTSLDFLWISWETHINKDKKKDQLKKEKFRADVLQWLNMQGCRKEATEMMMVDFLNKNSIYSIRDDAKPEMWIYREGIYIPNGKTYIQEYCIDILKESYTNYVVNEVVEKIRTNTYINQDEFFNVNNIEEIVLKNGILNVLTRKLRKWDSKTVFFNKIDVEFISQAKISLIKDFFNEILPNTSSVLTLQEIFGYCLLKDHRIEKGFMFTGEGRNGKSKVLELLKILLGSNNCTNVSLFKMESGGFIMGELMNKMANIAGDISGDALKNTDAFKSITGRDLQMADRKFKSHVKFISYAKNIFSANKLPKVYDTSLGFWSRWELLEFPYCFVDAKEYQLNKANPLYKLQDPNKINKITSEVEMNGLLNWALEGLDRLLKNKHFSSANSSNDVKNKWIRKSDSFMAFCMDNLDGCEDGKILKSDLRQKYSKYCKMHKIKIVGDKSIKWTLMEEYGADEEQNHEFSSGNRYWNGIVYKETTKKQGEQGISTHSKTSNFPTGSNTVLTVLFSNNSLLSDKKKNIILYLIEKKLVYFKDLFFTFGSIFNMKEPEFLELLTKMAKDGEIFIPKPDLYSAIV